MNGFIRHDSLNWNKLKKQKVKASCSEFIPYMSNYAIPSGVAPQQSSFPFQLNKANFNSINYIYKLSKKATTYQTVFIINQT